MMIYFDNWLVYFCHIVDTWSLNMICTVDSQSLLEILETPQFCPHPKTICLIKPYGPVAHQSLKIVTDMEDCICIIVLSPGFHS